MPSFTYMGTKKKLAGEIGTVCAPLAPGPFFDLFSGISAAGTAVANSRQVWCNDAQQFSKLLTEALYTSIGDGPAFPLVSEAVKRLGNRNLNVLLTRLHDLVELEQDALRGTNVDAFLDTDSSLRCAAAKAVGSDPSSEWQLFSTTYAGTYFGLTQCLQIDSIRCGIDKAHSSGIISQEDKRWAILALCKAMMATSNSTGHFAQFLTPSISNAKRVMSKRRRCVWSFWRSALSEFKATRSTDWRARNLVFSGDANDVLTSVANREHRPSIIYADPPYTNDQYSRYYHLLETVIRYDYPTVSGKGLYRPDRFRSSFSLSTEVESSFKTMICKAAAAAPSLVISYPSNGLMVGSMEKIPSMMAEYYTNVKAPLLIDHQHSTMGGSKGPNKENVEEVIFVATTPR
jgi:adenine-specific DNA-methyltransferase